MTLVRTFRYTTLGLMVGGLALLHYRPLDFYVLRRHLFWLIPAWIILLYVVQAATTPDVNGTTPLQALWNRLCNKGWTCPSCNRRIPIHVRYCRICSITRPELPEESTPDDGPEVSSPSDA